MTDTPRDPSNPRTSPPRFDLEERTARLGEDIIAFAKQIPRTQITEPLITQLVRSGTSVGANYCEADDAGSRKEFRYRISVCKRECRETKHWLRMMAAALKESADFKAEARKHWQETKELHLIFLQSTVKPGERDNSRFGIRH